MNRNRIVEKSLQPFVPDSVILYRDRLIGRQIPRSRADGAWNLSFAAELRGIWSTLRFGRC